jgi:hypothetical protein
VTFIGFVLFLFGLVAWVDLRTHLRRRAILPGQTWPILLMTGGAALATLSFVLPFV